MRELAHYGAHHGLGRKPCGVQSVAKRLERGAVAARHITKVGVIDERRDIAAALKETGGAPGQVRPSLLKRVR